MRCLIVQPIHPAGLERLREAGIKPLPASTTEGSVLCELIADSDAVITRDAGLSTALIAAAPRLKAIISHGTGIDSIDVDIAIARGIVVANTPGANAQSVAELALGLLVAAARGIVPADRAMQIGDATFRNNNQSKELSGKTALIVGWGHVGQTFGKMLRDVFDMSVLVFSPRADAQAVSRAGGQRQDNLLAALAFADVVSLHAQLRPETERMIGKQELAALKPGAILINTARADLIDECELVKALDDGRVFAAGLDLQQPGDRFIGRGDVVLTPHLGGTTEECGRRTAIEAAEAVIDILNGRPPVHPISSATGEVLRQ